jgi:hypothetical protein
MLDMRSVLIAHEGKYEEVKEDEMYALFFEILLKYILFVFTIAKF